MRKKKIRPGLLKQLSTANIEHYNMLTAEILERAILDMWIKSFNSTKTISGK